MCTKQLSRTLLLSSLAGVAIGPAFAAQTATTFPSHPVRLIIPYAPGGATDTSARPLAEKLRERWGQPVIVDNRAGASGNIALEIAATAAPDGHTLLVGNVSTNAINESIFNTTVKAFRRPDGRNESDRAASHLGGQHGDTREQPARVRRLCEEESQASQLRIRRRWIVSPSRRAGVSQADGAHDDARSLQGRCGADDSGDDGQRDPVHVRQSRQHDRAGEGRPHQSAGDELAHAASRVSRTCRRWPRPVFPGMGTNAWNGLFAPAKIPPALLNRIFTDVVQIMESQDMKDLLGKGLMSVVVNKSPAEYQNFVEAQAKKWHQVVVENNVKVE